jgi:hypothetical protein
MGAVAVIVGVLATLIIGIAAFAVDLGIVYASKRQLSVAADASALAAARDLNSAIPPGTVCSPATATALTAQAQAAAALANTQNDRAGGSTVQSVVVACTTDDFKVTVTNTRTSQAVFGRILGVNDFRPTGTATAQLFVPSVGVGLRPIAACYGTVEANYSAKTPFVVWIDKESAVCGTAASGEWGFTNFLDQGAYGEYDDSSKPAYFPEEGCANGNANSGGKAGCQEDWTRTGYEGPVTIPNLVTSPTSDNTGLAGNSGLAKSSGWRDAAESLVGQTIQLPVADTFSGKKRLNVLGVVTVRVCSAKIGKGGGSVTTVTPTPAGCSGRVQPTALQVPEWANDTFKNNEAALWVVPTDFVTSGVFGGPRAGCFGPTPPAGCQFGTRAVRLFQ